MTFLCVSSWGRLLCGSAERGDGDARNCVRVKARGTGGKKDVVALEPRRTTMPIPGAVPARVKSPLPVEIVVVPKVPNVIKTGLLPTIVGIPSADDLTLGLPAVKNEQNDRAESIMPVSTATAQNGRQAFGNLTNMPSLRVPGKALPSQHRRRRQKENGIKQPQHAPRRAHRHSRLSAEAAQKDVGRRVHPTPSVAPAVVNNKVDPDYGSRRRSLPSPPMAARACTLRPSASAPALIHHAPPSLTPTAPSPAPTGPPPARTPPSSSTARVSTLPPGVTSSPLVLRGVFEGLTRLPAWPQMLEAAGLEYTGDEQCDLFTDADIMAFFDSPEWVLIEEYLGIEVPMPSRDSTIQRVEVAPAVKNTQRREVEDVFWSPPPTAPSSSPARSPSAPAPVSAPPPSPTSSPRALRAAFEELVSLPDWHWLLEVSGHSYTSDDSFQQFTDADVAAFFDTPQWLELSKWLGPRYSGIGCAAAKSAQRWEEAEADEDAAAAEEEEDDDDGYDHWSDVVSIDYYHYGAWAIGEVEEGEDDVWPDFVPVNYGE